MMSIINHDILKIIDEKYNFFDIIIENINTRSDRMVMERVFACLIYLNDNKISRLPSLFGIIHEYCKWGLTWEWYQEKKILGTHKNLPVIKVWTGR
jgi:hypothetical protein